MWIHSAHGLTYKVASHLTPRDRCEDFAYAALREMTKMCYDVSEAEVTRAKNQLKAQMLFTQDSTHRECTSNHPCASYMYLLKFWGRTGTTSRM